MSKDKTIKKRKMSKKRKISKKAKNNKKSENCQKSEKFTSKIKDFHNFGLAAIFWSENNLKLATRWRHIISCLVLIAKSVSADANWLLPAGNEERNVFAKNRLAEDDAVQDVSDCSIWRSPHLLQSEFFDALLVGRNRRTFHGDIVFQRRVSRVDGDLEKS